MGHRTRALTGHLLLAGELGDRVLHPATSFDSARFAVVADPEGAVFALYAGKLDD